MINKVKPGDWSMMPDTSGFPAITGLIRTDDKSIVHLQISTMEAVIYLLNKGKE